MVVGAATRGGVPWRSVPLLALGTDGRGGHAERAPVLELLVAALAVDHLLVRLSVINAPPLGCAAEEAVRLHHHGVALALLEAADLLDAAEVRVADVEALPQAPAVDGVQESLKKKRNGRRHNARARL